jgi:hypothetical protein
MEVFMREIIIICILGLAALFSLPLWFLFIARMEQEHINPDICDTESRRAWAPDVKEKFRRALDIRSLRGKKSRPIPLRHKHYL